MLSTADRGIDDLLVMLSTSDRSIDDLKCHVLLIKEL